jgi:hypothetical protein
MTRDIARDGLPSNGPRWRILVTCVAVPVSAMVGFLFSAPAASAAGVPLGTEPVATTLVASPVSIVQSVTTLVLTYSARLTNSATGTPVAGQFILFSDTAALPSGNPLKDLICEPQTNGNGVATCSVSILNVGNTLYTPTYTAEFFGAAQYLPVTARGSLSLT